MLINNEIYQLNFSLYEDYMFIHNFHISKKYRGRKYSYRIFDKLFKRFNLNTIALEYFPTMEEYNSKLGFVYVRDAHDGYVEMEKGVDKLLKVW